MTVAQLKEQMDRRFRTVDARFDAVAARFDSLDAQFRRLFRSVESLGRKVDTNSRGLSESIEHFTSVASEHDKRIKDLEPPPPLQGASLLGSGREG